MAPGERRPETQPAPGSGRRVARSRIAQPNFATGTIWTGDNLPSRLLAAFFCPGGWPGGGACLRRALAREASLWRLCCPGIDNFDVDALEVRDVASHQHEAAGAGYGGNPTVGFLDRSARAAAPKGDLRIVSGGGAVERQIPVAESHVEPPGQGGFQLIFAPAGRDDCDAVGEGDALRSPSPTPLHPADRSSAPDRAGRGDRHDSPAAEVPELPMSGVRRAGRRC